MYSEESLVLLASAGANIVLRHPVSPAASGSLARAAKKSGAHIIFAYRVEDGMAAQLAKALGSQVTFEHLPPGR